MTRETFFEIAANLGSKALNLLKKKSSDYAHGDDPFRNFRRHGRMGVYIRLEDKLARLESFEKKGAFEVDGETFEDTIIDIINYAAIAYALFTEEKNP